MTPQKRAQLLWALADVQDGAIHRDQLIAGGLSEDAIRHRVRTGRLHRKWPRVFAVGRPDLTPRGMWIGALLTCGAAACLSHGSGMAYYGIGVEERGLEVSVPRWIRIDRDGISLHQRTGLIPDHIYEDGPIRVTTPALTLVDFASCHGRSAVERAVNEADKRDLIDPESLRRSLDQFRGWHGSALLRDVLDRLTFTLTDSELERWLLPIARRAGLATPLTQQWVNGFRVDFHWPRLGLVVETDGLRYHRTPAQQAKDRRRDQVLTAAGLTVLRFTHGQIRFEPRQVETTLATVLRRLTAAA